MPVAGKDDDKMPRLSRKARAAAERHAGRLGMTVSDWLNHQVLDAGASEDAESALISVGKKGAGTYRRTYGRNPEPTDGFQIANKQEPYIGLFEHEHEGNASKDVFLIGTKTKAVADLLGGTAVLKRELESALDAHELLMHGLPAGALTHLLGELEVPFISLAHLEKAMGMSVRTLQRRKLDPSKPLNPEQSGRTWKLAEVVAKATGVFGSRHEAQQWLQQPSIALGQRTPLELLSTSAGAELVEAHLGRLEYGVYT